MNDKKEKIKIVTDWSFADLGASFDDDYFIRARKRTKKLSSDFNKKWTEDASYLHNVKKLKEALDEYAEIEESDIEREYLYLFLKKSLDLNNPEIEGRYKKFMDFIRREISDKIRFFNLSLARVDKNTQSKFLKSPLLSRYHKFLRDLFATAKYSLSEKEEKILSLVSAPGFENWVKMTNEAFAKSMSEVLTRDGNKRVKKEKTFWEIMSLLSDGCKRVRTSAVKAVEETILRNIHIAEKEFNSVLEYKKITDDLRGYERPDMPRILSDDITPKILDTMTGAVKKYFKISQRYYRLKARLKGSDKLEYHERNLLLPKPSAEPNYSFEESADIVMSVFSQLDGEFADIFAEMLEGGKIDVYPKQNREGGAFCVEIGHKNPVYVLLNHTGKTADVLTLAHEMGHAVNFKLVHEHEDPFYGNVGTFVAETASTFCEGLVSDYLLSSVKTDKQKLIMMMSRLNGDISTIMRQIAGYFFEVDVHAEFRKAGYLSEQDIGEMFVKNMKDYMGDAVLQNHHSEKWWSYWSHFRRPFYVYSYASGLLLSKGMIALLREDANNWNKLKKLFLTGSSKSPRKLFKSMGINIESEEFWVGGLKLMEKDLKEAEKLAKKLGFAN